MEGVAKILELEDPEEVLYALFERVQPKLQSPENLNPVEAAIWHIWDLQNEVDNGGFHQYLGNSSGDNATRALRTLKLIDATEKAALLESALGHFGEGGPSADRGERLDQMDTWGDGELEALEELGDRFSDSSEHLAALLTAYCRKHRAVL